MIRVITSLCVIIFLLNFAARCEAQFQLSEPEADESSEAATNDKGTTKKSAAGRTNAEAADTPPADDDSPRTAPLRRSRKAAPDAASPRNAPAPKSVQPLNASSEEDEDSAPRRNGRSMAQERSVPLQSDARIVLIEEDPDPGTFWTGPVPRRRAIAEDATLFDVCMVGSQVWAVGDHGVVCSSSDGGTTWTTLMTPFPCRLTSVCFLTNRVGWIGGIRFDRGVPGGEAVLLATRDGGQSWKDLAEESRSTPGLIGATSQLPGILSLQYFGLDDAIAITLPGSTKTASTLFRSVDGGISWEAIEADQPVAPWLAGAFISPNEGIVVGQRQQYASIVSREAVVVNTAQATLRSVRGASLDSSGHGWIAGDGGQLLATTNGGVTWNVPAGELPDGLSDVFDARSVAHKDSLVLVAGVPASVVLRSADEGATWDVVTVPASGHVQRIRVSADNTFFAVGSFGQILRSVDEGASWECVRSLGTHAGLLAFTSDATAAPIQLLSSLTAETGVRSSVVQISQVLDLSSPDAASFLPFTHADLGLASLSVDGLEGDWAFPRTIKGQEISPRQLIAEWNRQTDGRLRELLPLRLARTLCTWRPVLVVVESTSEKDAVASLLSDALEAAESLAANPEGTALEKAGLQPWTISRVATRTPGTQRTSISFDDSDLLKALGTTSGLLCDSTEAVLRSGESFSASVRPRAGYVVLRDSADNLAVEHLLAGLERELTSEVRRSVPVRSREQLREMQRIVQTAKLEAGALDGHQGLQKSEEAFVAELETIGTELPPALALRQLSELAALNLDRNNVEGYFAIQQELMRRFPESDEARKAAETLLVLYSSAEIRHYRTRLQSNPDASPPGSPGKAGTDESLSGEVAQNGFQPIRMTPSIQPASATVFSASPTPQLNALSEKWNAQAQIAWTLLNRKLNGSAANERKVPPEAILRQAVSMRVQDKSGECSTLLTQLSPLTNDIGVWATSEMQVLQGMTPTLIRAFNVPRSADRPYLDGVLNDQIWEDAEEITLAAPRVSGASVPEANEGSGRDLNQPKSLVMIAWDDQFLYVAGKFQRADSRQPLELASGRTHDANHGSLDRLEIAIDTDRDFLTAFELVIDETGQTTDSAWWLKRWNPQWYVAADSDDASWRIEAAIPMKELSSTPVRPGNLWSIRFRRAIPGVLEQELAPAAATTSMKGASLVRFIRPKVKTGDSR
ncbi:MAG: YCF48-related protein [Planctomycetaceae bacterium]